MRVGIDDGEAVVDQTVRAARDLLLELREDHAAAVERFAWPELEEFNFALEWFDPVARGNDRDGLVIVGGDGSVVRRSFDELARGSDRVAGWLRSLGVARGDRVLVMLGNQVELWLVLLAAMKLGAVVIPATPLLAPADLRDRIDRGAVRHVVARSEDAGKFADVAGSYSRVAVGGPVRGWRSLADADEADEGFVAEGATRADDPLLLYFTSGTTSRPKLVEHTQVSYPVGHLSTMYWLGLQPGDVHLNVSSPGWAKHAWSNVFAPWLAEATVLVHDYVRFDPSVLLGVLRDHGVTSLCAPPTVRRLLIQCDLGKRPTALREVLAAGEPLNPEVIERVRAAWGLTIRDGYGQTETTAQIGNTPGQRVKLGSMGRPLPGYAVRLVDPISGEPVGGGREGEICLDLRQRPLGLMAGYRGDAELTAEATRGGWYHTGDVAVRDDEGYITFVGRTDDVFKASDYRISPFELESVLLEHDAVAEAAVVPSPDPLRLAVPKAYVVLAAGWEPTRETAVAILGYARERLAPYQRIRRLEFAGPPRSGGPGPAGGQGGPDGGGSGLGELPKTISGKIRRVELRARERDLRGADPDARPDGEWGDDDLPELRSSPAPSS